MRTGRRTAITTASGMAGSMATSFRVVNVCDDLSRATSVSEIPSLWNCRRTRFGALQPATEAGEQRKQGPTVSRV